MLSVEESIAAAVGPVLPNAALLLVSLLAGLSGITVDIGSVWML